jgi:hypothetical protein
MVDVDPPAAQPNLLLRLQSTAEEGEILGGGEVSLLGRLGLGLEERLGEHLVPAPRPRRRLKKRGKKKK